MATKDITDKQVLQAYAKYNALAEERMGGKSLMEYLSEKTKPTEIKWPYDFLMEETGQPFKVCYRAMERACNRDLIDYGISLRAGWVTEEGRALIAQADAANS